MTVEHFLGLVDSDHDMEVFASFAWLVSQGCVPRGALEGFRLGHVTALRKPDGGIRGIIVGDIIRRLIARTIAQQISKQVEEATAPHQCALQTKSGCECVSHMATADRGVRGRSRCIRLGVTIRHVARVGQHDWWRASPPFRSTPILTLRLTCGRTNLVSHR